MERAASMLAAPPDLQVVGSYLSHLLPALRSNWGGQGDPLQSLQLLGLEPKVLAIRGVPEHTVAALYRSLAAQASVWQQLVSSELGQLKEVLQQQGGAALSSTVQLLDGPILVPATTAAAAGAAATASAASTAASAAKAADEAKGSPAANKEAGPASRPSAGGGDDPVTADFAAAYASMKEMLEIKLRHESKRGDFLDAKLKETEAHWREVTQQLELSHMQAGHLRNDCANLQQQLTALQQAYAACQSELVGTKETLAARTTAWQEEKAGLLHDHEEKVAGLTKELEVASEAAVALKESQHQVEALRLLYNQELARASRASLDMTRAVAQAEAAVQQEESWRRQLLKSDSRVGHAEGLSSALNAQVQQLSDELAEAKEQLQQLKEELDFANVTLERNGVAAVQYRAFARAHMRRMGAEMQKLTETTQAATRETAQLQDHMRIKTLELDGAKAQLLANRGHLKQLMSDLEQEQEKTSALNNTLTGIKNQVESVTSARDVAQSRVKQLQAQLTKANEASLAMASQMDQLKEVAEERIAAAGTLQQKLDDATANEAMLRSQVETQHATILRLCGMEEQLQALRNAHNLTLEEMERLTASNRELQKDADELVVVSAQLRTLQAEHELIKQSSLRSSALLRQTEKQLQETQQQLEDTNAELDELGAAYDELEQEAWELEKKIELMEAASQNADAKVLELNQQVESLQTLLDQNDADRQQLAAQRDGWMSSYQEAMGKLQQLATSSNSAQHHLLTRTAALTQVVESLNNQVASTAEAALNLGSVAAAQSKEALAAAGTAAAAPTRASRPGTAGSSGSRPGTAGSAIISATAAAAAAASEAQQKTQEQVAVLQADTAGLVEQLGALHVLMAEQAAQQDKDLQEVLEALSSRVNQRHQAAQDAWQVALKAALAKRARTASHAAVAVAGRRGGIAAARANAVAGSGAQAVLGTRFAPAAAAAAPEDESQAPTDTAVAPGAAAPADGQLDAPAAGQQPTVQQQDADTPAAAVDDAAAESAPAPAATGETSAAAPDSSLALSQSRPRSRGRLGTTLEHSGERGRSPSSRPGSSAGRPGTSSEKRAAASASDGLQRTSSLTATFQLVSQQEEERGPDAQTMEASLSSMRVRRRASVAGARRSIGGASLRTSLRARRVSAGGILSAANPGDGMFGVSAAQLMVQAAATASLGSSGGAVDPSGVPGIAAAPAAAAVLFTWPVLPAAVASILAALPATIQTVQQQQMTPLEVHADSSAHDETPSAPAAAAVAPSSRVPAAAAHGDGLTAVAAGVAAALAATPGLTQEAAAAAVQALMAVLSAQHPVPYTSAAMPVALGAPAAPGPTPVASAAPAAAGAAPVPSATPAAAGAAPTTTTEVQTAAAVAPEASSVQPAAETATAAPPPPPPPAGPLEATHNAVASSSPSDGQHVAGPAATDDLQKHLQTLQAQLACLQQAYEQLRAEGQGRLAAANAQARLQQSLVSQLQEQLHCQQQQQPVQQDSMGSQPTAETNGAAAAAGRPALAAGAGTGNAAATAKLAAGAALLTTTDKHTTAAALSAAAAAKAAAAVGDLMVLPGVSNARGPPEGLTHLLPPPGTSRWHLGGEASATSLESPTAGASHPARQPGGATNHVRLMVSPEPPALQAQPSAEDSSLWSEASTEALPTAAAAAASGMATPAGAATPGRLGRATANPAGRRARASHSKAGALNEQQQPSPTSSLAGFVALSIYQTQVKATSELQHQVGQLKVQLHEAQAAAESTQSQLNQERQEHTARTVTLRTALANAQESLAELRSDHEVLQQAHSRLMAKDLMKSGLLKDRYVADLFARLQEAEWKLGLARRRAATWGQPLMVPLGRINRGIQTQISEIWAMGDPVQDAGAGFGRTLLATTTVTSDVQTDPDSPRRSTQAVQDTRSSSLTRRKALSPIPAELTSKTSSMGMLPQSTLVSSPRGSVPRLRAAFTIHDPVAAAAAAEERLAASCSSSSMDGLADLLRQVGQAPWLEAAEHVNGVADVPVLTGPMLLMLIAQIYSSKAQLDAAALASKQPVRPLWQVAVLQNLQYNSSPRSLLKHQHLQQHTTAVISPADIDVATDADTVDHSGTTEEALLAVAASAASATNCQLHASMLLGLAQLLASCHHHASALQEVARFLQLLQASADVTVAQQQQQQTQLLLQQHQSSTASSTALITQQRPTSPAVPSVVQSDTWWSTLRVDWGKKKPTNVADLLLPHALSRCLSRLTSWPGMRPLLQWVSTGEFMEEMRDNDLGQPLQDVQAPDVHFALLEAADILGVSPLPIVHVLPTDAFGCHLLRIPCGWAAHSKPSARARQLQRNKSSNVSNDFAWSRQALLLLGRGTLRGCTLPQLQALIAAALAPMAAPGGTGRDLSSDKLPANAEEEICMADVATLSALLTVQPRIIQRHARRNLQTMGLSSMLTALRAAMRMTSLSGDRGALLVAQDVLLALEALLKASPVAVEEEEMQGSLLGPGYWLKQAVDQQGLQQWSVAQLLPQHPAEAAGLAGSGGAGTEGTNYLRLDAAALAAAGADELSEEQVLLMRVHELTNWASSPQYAAVLAAATPLRKVLPPPSRRQLSPAPMSVPHSTLQQKQHHQDTLPAATTHARFA